MRKPISIDGCSGMNNWLEAFSLLPPSTPIPSERSAIYTYDVDDLCQAETNFDDESVGCISNGSYQSVVSVLLQFVVVEAFSIRTRCANIDDPDEQSWKKGCCRWAFQLTTKHILIVDEEGVIVAMAAYNQLEFVCLFLLKWSITLN